LIGLTHNARHTPVLLEIISPLELNFFARNKFSVAHDITYGGEVDESIPGPFGRAYGAPTILCMPESNDPEAHDPNDLIQTTDDRAARERPPWRRPCPPHL
jgi:hypothetical protein